MTRFELERVALPEHIDILGHVNNAVWVRWMEEVATAHWHSLADPAHEAAYIWLVTRHEIDYLRALTVGRRVIARTWVDAAPRGARFDRLMEFAGEDGRIHVRARTTWAILDRTTARPIRVPPDVVAPFLH